MDGGLWPKKIVRGKGVFPRTSVVWYEQASPGLAGLEKVRVDKQIETLAPAAGREPARRPRSPRHLPRRARCRGQRGADRERRSVSGVKYFPEKMINPADTSPTSYGPTPCEFIITLDKVYQLQQIRFKLQDKTTAAYCVFVSRDGSKYELLQDCGNQRMEGWQNLPFTARPVKCIKLTCNGPRTTFCIDSFEAYCYPVCAQAARCRTEREMNRAAQE